MKGEKIHIFFNMILENNNYIFISDYSEILDVSERTVHNYINRINDLLLENGLDAKIISHRGLGIKLEGDRSQLYKKYNTISPEMKGLSVIERRNIILERILMFDQVVTTNDLAEEFFVSPSSIHNDLKIIDEGLERWSVMLIRDNHGTVLGGEEAKIRNAKKEHIFLIIEKEIKSGVSPLKSCLKVLEIFYDKSIVKSLVHSKDIFELNLETKISTNYISLFYIHLAVQIDRVLKGKFDYEEVESSIVANLHSLKTYPVAQEISFYLENELGYEMPTIEVKNLNATLASIYQEERIIYNNVTKSEKIIETVDEMLNLVKDIFSYDIKADKLLVHGLEKHFIPMVLRINNSIKIRNPYLNTLKKQYPAMFSIVRLICNYAEKKLDLTINDDEVSFVMVHFQASLERNKESLKIGVISSDEDAIKQMLMNQLVKIFSVFDVLELIPINRMNDIDFINNFDLIVSTVAMSNYSVPFIQISSVIDDFDIHNITKEYLQILKQDQKLIRENLIDVIDKEVLFVKHDLDSKIDIIDYMCENLEGKGFVKESFKDTVLERERSSSTEVGRGIATPHGHFNFVNKSVISVMVLDKPILWGEEIVDIIIMLALDFEDKEMMSGVLKDLYNLIDDDESLTKLRLATSIDELYKTIVK